MNLSFGSDSLSLNTFVCLITEVDAHGIAIHFMFAEEMADASQTFHDDVKAVFDEIFRHFFFVLGHERW